MTRYESNVRDGNYRNLGKAAGSCEWPGNCNPSDFRR